MVIDIVHKLVTDAAEVDGGGGRGDGSSMRRDGSIEECSRGRDGGMAR